METLLANKKHLRFFEVSKINFSAYQLNYNSVKPSVSIVMAYYKRQQLLKNTLDRFQDFICSQYEFEIIIVDDGSNEDWDWIQKYQYQIVLIIVNPQKKRHKNPCAPYNIGFSFAAAEKILIQNPECYHADNILDFSHKLSIDNDYITFSCYSLNRERSKSPESYLSYKLENKPAFHGEEGWYNHKKYRNSFYHFCSLISKDNLKKLKGFDQRFAFGNDFDDDEFLYRIRDKGINPSISDLAVLHQWHYSGHRVNTSLHLRNKFIYSYITSAKLSPKFLKMMNLFTFGNNFSFRLFYKICYLIELFYKTRQN